MCDKIVNEGMTGPYFSDFSAVSGIDDIQKLQKKQF